MPKAPHYRFFLYFPYLDDYSLGNGFGFETLIISLLGSDNYTYFLWVTAYTVRAHRSISNMPCRKMVEFVIEWMPHCTYNDNKMKSSPAPLNIPQTQGYLMPSDLSWSQNMTQLPHTCLCCTDLHIFLGDSFSPAITYLFKTPNDFSTHPRALSFLQSRIPTPFFYPSYTFFPRFSLSSHLGNHIACSLQLSARLCGRLSCHVDGISQ